MALKTFKPYTKSTRGTVVIDKKTLWKNEGDYPTFLKATNWFSKAQSLTEPRIFEALKLAGLDK